MTLRQIEDASPGAVPFYRAGFMLKILEPYIKEAKRRRIHSEARYQLAWSVAQALRDLRHVCDSYNADFAGLEKNAIALYERDGTRSPNPAPQPRIEQAPAPAPKIIAGPSVPIPSEGFKGKQKEYAEYVSPHRTVRVRNEKKKEALHRELEAEFMKAFGLADDDGKVARKFYRRFENTRLQPESKVFDHKTFYRRGKNIVIASQPYGIDGKELVEWVKSSGATLTVAPEWGFYYPGEASLFFVEFTPEAKDEFDARVRALYR